jgi:hypothetical protein
MKNIAFVAHRQAETVSHQDLIDAMDPNYEFTQDEILDLLPDRPRAAVRDTLHALVERGVVWRNASQARIKYALLTGERLQEAIERKTSRGETPAWMKSNLVGYDAAHTRFYELCMTVRK